MKFNELTVEQKKTRLEASRCAPCLYRCGLGLKAIRQRMPIGYSVDGIRNVLIRAGVYVLGGRGTDCQYKRAFANPSHSTKQRQTIRGRLTKTEALWVWAAEWAGVRDCYWGRHPEWIKAYSLARYYANHERNKAKSRAIAARYYEKKKNVPEYKALKRLYSARWKHGPANKEMNRVRQVLNSALRAESINSAIGTTKQGLVAWIESQFKRGMTWDNYGKAWHIDHIVPLVWYRDNGRLNECNHYTNLRPMWAADNIRKGGKMPGQVQPELLMTLDTPPVRKLSRYR